MRIPEAKIPALTYAITVAIAAAWLAGIVAAPLLLGRAINDSGRADSGGLESGRAEPHQLRSVRLAATLYRAYEPVCHQIADRSFHVGGRPMAACARCFGVYAGVLAGLLILPFARSRKRVDAPPRIWLILALTPLAADFVGGYAGLFDNTPASRLATGLVAGAAGAFYALPGLVALAGSLAGSRHLTARAAPAKQ